MKEKWSPWMMVGSYSLLGICFPAAVTQFSLLVPDMAAILHIDIRTVLLADSLRAVCLVIAIFLSGYVYRRLGSWKTICLGLLMQILPQFLIPLALRLQIVPLFFLFKAVQGFNAVAFPVYLSNIAVRVSPNKAGLATSIFNGSFMAGAGIGAWLSGRLLFLLGWQNTFYFLGFLCLILAVPALYFTLYFEGLSGTGKIRMDKIDKNERTIQNDVYGGIIGNPLIWLLILALSANTWVMQTITVDMPVYLHLGEIAKTQSGSLMLAIGLVTVIASIGAGAVSDFFAGHSVNPVRGRSMIMAGGYMLGTAAILIFAFLGYGNFGLLALFACFMTAGVSWAAGVFWALPSLLFNKHKNLAATAFCSGASNIVNPLAPFVSGVVLGSAGHWKTAWLICAAISLVSFATTLIISQKRPQNRRYVFAPE
jgi:predicted MFS family arabinose efflux permease